MFHLVARYQIHPLYSLMCLKILRNTGNTTCCLESEEDSEVGAEVPSTCILSRSQQVATCLSEQSPHEFVVSVVSFKPSSIQHDAQIVNKGPI